MKGIVVFLIMLFASVSFAETTVVYRISSGEVKGISTTGETWDLDASPFFTKVIDPIMLDGNIWQGPDPTNRNRVFGYAKIYVDGTVRNATQQEIDTFAGAKTNDHNIREAAEAINDFQNDPQLRRIITAFADILVSEINILRNQHGLPDRTLSQLKTAILNRISKDD